MSPQQLIARGRFQLAVLGVSVVCTWLVLGWFVWVSSRWYGAAMLKERLMRIEELRGTIVYLDEVLTMSARMAAATGQDRWETRYRNFELALDDAIKELMALSPELAGSEPAARTDAANLALVEMENRVFGLVRDGHLAEAQELLDSPRYQEQKALYADGINVIAAQLRGLRNAAIQTEQRRAFWNALAVLVVAPILLWGWAVVWRTTRAWQAILLGLAPSPPGGRPGA